MHLDPKTLAGLASAFPVIEAEVPRRKPPYPRIGQLCIELPDPVEHLDVGRRVAARRKTDRGLIDIDHLVDAVHPPDVVVISSGPVDAIQPRRQGPVKDVVHKR